MTRFGFIIRKFFGNLLSRPLAALGSILSLALLFLLFNLIWISSLTIHNYYDKIISDIEIEVFLDDAIPDSTVAIINDALETLDGIDTITYISREKAREQLDDLMGVDLLEGFETNPLPRSFVISFQQDYLNTENLNRLSNDLKRMAGVTDIFYPSGWLSKAEYTKMITSEVLMLLGIVIAIAVVLNTIQFIILSARTRAEELVQLRLLGAGPIFLALPYILEGIFYTMVASVSGWVLLYYTADLYSFRDIELILPNVEEIIYFCQAASLIGMIGGYLGIRREL